MPTIQPELLKQHTRGRVHLCIPASLKFRHIYFHQCAFLLCTNAHVPNCLQRSVPLQDVAKFNEVLSQNNISSTRGIFVTQSQFSKRALLCAQSHGIEAIDGDTLARMEAKGVQRERRSHLIAVILCLCGATVWCRSDDPRVQHLINLMTNSNRE